ncbi:MAG: acyl-CoA dehydrogenase family protein [Sphingomonadaceae bacterium]|nr:acyl-CoA dehydrogenase family protein [Sphingomonadaceae bacterium]
MLNSPSPSTGEVVTTEDRDTDEQRAFRLKARDWMKDNLPPRLPDEAANAFEDLELVARDRELQTKIHAAGFGGLQGIPVPVEYGGLGLDQRFEDIFFEEATPYRLPWHFGNATNIVIPCLLEHGTEEQKRKYLPKILDGTHYWAQLLSEPSGGSDLAGVLTRAEKRGDTWILNGSKVWTSGGHICDMGLCLARTDASLRKHAGLTMFLVDMHHPGMTVNQIELVMGGADFCQEFLDDVEVPDEDVLGEVNGGWKVAGTQLVSERKGMARGWFVGLNRAEVLDGIELSERYGMIAKHVGVEKDPQARQLLGEVFVYDTVKDLIGKRINAGIRNGTFTPEAGSISSLMSSVFDIDRTRLLSALAGPEGIAASPDEGELSIGIGMSRVTTHRIGGGTLEMQLNLVAERHLGLPRELGPAPDTPFNQLKANKTAKIA